MIFLSGRLTWNLGKIPARADDQARVFAWLTKESPLKKTLTGVSFSYKRGWSIDLIVPIDRTAKDIEELQCLTLRLLGVLPKRAEDEALQVVDFAMPMTVVTDEGSASTS